MKTPEEIRKRLEKLRVRYCKNFFSEVRSKKPHNCVHNAEHHPSKRKPVLPTEVELAPRIVTTLVVIQPDSPIRLCMYGSEKPDLWNGDVCDDDATAASCPYFEAKISEDEANDEFNKLMADDAYVLEHYKDVATLQWVLNERVYETELSFWGRLTLWFGRIFHRSRQRQNLLPEKTEEVDGDLWDVDAENSGK